MSPGTIYAASSFSELELLFPVAYEWETGQMTGPFLHISDSSPFHVIFSLPGQEGA